MDKGGRKDVWKQQKLRKATKRMALCCWKALGEGHHDNLAQRVTKLGAQRQYDGICCRWYWGAHVPEWLLNFSGPRAFTLFGMWEPFGALNCRVLE